MIGSALVKLPLRFDLLLGAALYPSLVGIPRDEASEVDVNFGGEYDSQTLGKSTKRGKRVEDEAMSVADVRIRVRQRLDTRTSANGSVVSSAKARRAPSLP